MNNATRLHCAHPRGTDQTGLFAVVLVTFLLISYPLLQPDVGDKTNQLLTQITQQLPPNGTQQFPLSRADESNDPPFRPRNYALRVNAMWLTSLSVSLACALWATLVQQWARSFYLAADTQVDESVPHTLFQRARIYKYFSVGVKMSAFPAAVEILPGLLHISLILFFAGLIDLLFNVNHILAYVILTWVSIGLTTYLFFTFIPFIYPKSPYQTPLSLLLWLAKELSILLWLLPRPRRNRKAIHARLATIWNGWRRARELNAITSTSQDKAKIEEFHPAITSPDEGHELEELLDGLLGLSYEPGRHYSVGLGEGPQTQRLAACLRAIWCHSSTIDRHFRAIWEHWDRPTNDPWGRLSTETWEVALRMTTHSDHFIAFRAHCIQALMVFMWRKGRWHCAVPVAVALLERQLGVPQADINKWLSTKDHLLFIVASHMLSHSIPLLHLHKQKTGADSGPKGDLKMILDKICDELDESDVPTELRSLFVDGAKVMQVFNHPDEANRSHRWAKIFRGF